MFKGHVLHLLRTYLGEYVHGLSAEALKISVWNGDVELRDLQLKAEALNSLKLPVIVKAGFVGSICLKVPWQGLGKEPVIVDIDRVFVLVHPVHDGRTVKKEDMEKLFEAKIHQIEEAESATLEAMEKSKLGSPSTGNSWFGSLVATIIGNLRVSISNVHIRYEDSVSNPGYPFTSGITLAKLAAVTMDKHGNETFDTSGALDKLRKSLRLERLALYHDTNSGPWKIDKKWEDLSPREWIEIFEDGVNEPSANSRMVSKWAINRNYLVSPINGVLNYHRLGNEERNNPEVPFEKAALVLSDVSLRITEAQYQDWIKLLEVISRYRTYIEVSHLRPLVPISEAPYLWWRYAAQASMQQTKMCYRFSWDRIQYLCHLRRRYIQLYADALQQLANVDNSEIREIEKDLDSKVILLWRLLAHAKVAYAHSKKAAELRKKTEGSWFSMSWLEESEDDYFEDAVEELEPSEEKLTKEEWQAIHNLLNHQPDKGSMSHSGKGTQNMILFLVTVSVGHAAARIISIDGTEIVCGRFEELHVSTKLKHHGIQCDVLLKYYGLSAPEGSLAKSVCSEQKVNALTANFVHKPVGENVDWRLSATISPCHVTILMESCDRFLEFVKRSNEVSPTVASETATALQMEIEKVTRQAQKQFQMVLEEKSRFALDIDFDAPKVRVPIKALDSSKQDSHFLLDFGHFTLYTKEHLPGEHGHDLYSRFYISGRDITAFFTDCCPDCKKCSSVTTNYCGQQGEPEVGQCDSFYPLSDKCGMAVIVDKIKVPHPSYPSTCISVQVPSLGIHLSPARYSRLMELLNILSGTTGTCSHPTADNLQAKLGPSSSIDLATNARVLVWKGIGNSTATWQPCFLMLSGLYLYVLETEMSPNYQRYLSLASRQVFEVPSGNVGGSEFCIAVSFRGMENQKALESSSTWVIEFQDMDAKNNWLQGLVKAIYKASAPPSANLLDELSDSGIELDESHATKLRTADIVINGTLVESKLFMYGKSCVRHEEHLEEVLIVEVLFGGAKVNIIRWEGDLAVKMKLHSLKIKDEFQGRQSMNLQYLALSVLKNENVDSSIETFDSCVHEREIPKQSPEDNDNFTDAVSDFLSLSEPSFSPHNMDISAMTWDFSDSAGVESPYGSSHKRDPVKGISGDILYEAHDESNDFVSVTFAKKSSDSPNYDGIDTQMTFCMSQLEFNFSRPTLVALIGLGSDLNHCSSSSSDTEKAKNSDDISSDSKENAKENGHIKGLLGFGKGRVVFCLNMNIKSVTVFLNKEDGSQLAMFVQESFLLDYKVYPCSMSVEGKLGNLRVCDMWLGSDHCWGWLCDIRNPEEECSLIKFKFDSYSAEDDDYEGYDFSLNGQLSAVRIVFLYRFVTELTAYFTELATPGTEESIKLVDKVGDFEWLVQKREIDGATALKLDLYFDTPIIIIPRNSMSKDSIQFDMGQLRVTNELIWHGCPEKDPSAVHVDVLHFELIGMNMCVGINGCLGKPVIRESHGFDVYVRRSLRDVFRQVPTVSIEAKIGLLHGVMSDKEYEVIVDCSHMNLSEEPSVPPSFRGHSYLKDTTQLLTDKADIDSHMILSRTITILAVEINYALLELCTGTPEALPLAHIVLEDLWVSYRMTKLSEADLYVTIPKFSILDVRPDTKPEMRLMFGSTTDASKQASTGRLSFSSNRGSIMRKNSGIGDVDIPYSTMFLMDCRWRLSSKSFVLRIQQPRVLVVPEFLLAVSEFFVPSLKSVTGREETMNPMNDPISRKNCIILSEAYYKQREDVVYLSTNRQLVADAPGVNEYTYDGCGKMICLTEETEMKDHVVRSQPIIFIGRGKRLRFVNVKIENGSLLMRSICLSNDSSYSVCIEDGVDILYSDKSPPGDEKINYTQKSSDTSNSSSSPQSSSSSLQSFTFETQVVSADFTFYDGTKSYLDDSSYGEKLIHAKMDLSFMYASKEKDTWIRALLKDLTIEAGSGFIILHPVDSSWSYTFVEDKTSISVLSTDICIHLSLSAMSLVLNLQSQVAKAFQYGNSSPVAPCTNYDRLWVSRKGNRTHNNLTFWRPQAPSSYVIFGDCVTSRPTPPSQAVMAVNNTYGRVRKPVGFNLVGLLSNIQGCQENEGQSDVECDCSLWMPVAPPGYMALGCVTNTGNQPPPIHIVYCIRTDLVTSATYSDCIYTGRSNHCFPSGFSIWRLDNVLGSFYAHSSAECPPNYSTCDLSHLLLSNWNRQQPSSKEPSPSYESKQKNNQTKTPSGWDVIRTISKANDCFISTPNFERIWWDKGNGLRRPVSIWRPVSRAGYGILGDCVTDGLEPPGLGIIFKTDCPEISAKPVQFTKVAHIVGREYDEVFFWYPIAPSGYASLGCVVTRTNEAPHVNLFCCPRMDLVNQADITEVSISSSSKSSSCWSIWRVENQACTFLARSDLKKPPSRMAFTIGDSVRTKAQENITAEMKLRFFSVTLLDSLCGKMTPVVDTTITNIRLATHGRAEAMNAVLISSIATSIFNTQLEAWEPLIEPFDGIFKFETFDTNVLPPARIGKRMRLAATSILNINVSAASLETFVQTITSWRRHVELDEKATRVNEEADSHSRQEENLPLSALEEDDFPTVTVENKLGCDIYLKRVQYNSDKVDLIHYGDCASLSIQPPRFSDRLNVADESKEACHYVAVLILEAKGLPMIDDGNGYKYFCALRLVVDSQATNQQKLFPQSARTRSLAPLISRSNDQDEGTVRWNELFIFEVPQKGMSKFEVEVTNLAAKAGKGDVVGTFSYSIGRGANMLKKMSSVEMMQQAYDYQNFVAYPLSREGQSNEVEYLNDYGHIMISTCCFDRKSAANTQRDLGNQNAFDRDVGFWIGVGPEGTWESIRSLLPLSVIPKTLQGSAIAMEVVMENGKKHALIRGLVTVVNDCDVTMDASICHLSLLNARDSSLGANTYNIVVEEIFENQRYTPSGWISNDPGSWSTKDFSQSSKDFCEPSLPFGWQWTSTWTIDKSQVYDEEGWAYGSDFQSLNWPPASSKSCTKSEIDVVRRRRWTRTRQKSSEQGVDWFKGDSIAISPGCSAVLPWRSAFRGSDQCLQVRPSVSYPNPAYDWGCGVAVGYYTFGKDQQFIDQLSLTRQTSFKQGNKTPDFTFKLNQLEKKDILMSCLGNKSKQFWLSVGTDASVLQSELNTPVYDWKISINSPLKLENRLPCRAEFTIWEKTKDGNSIGRQNGMISSRECVHIYSADLQKPIYLTLFLQGGWVLEKDPVVVLDLSTVDRVSSFWMVHQESTRRLRISVERDFGGSSAAPKTIRFFVPYWIVNDSSLTLAYRLVEIEPAENKNADSPPSSPSLKMASPLKRAVSSAAFSFRNPTFSWERKSSFTRRNIQVFELIDDTSPIPSMLSPQDYVGRSGISMFPSKKDSSQKDAYLSPRVGIAVAIHSSDTYGPGVSLLELENKQRVDVKAFSSDGSYHKLSALLNITSDRTKVIHFQPHTLYFNRAGCSICLQQCDTHVMEWIHPTDPPKPFAWQSYTKIELLRLRVEGYRWSTPFSVSTEGVERISLKKESGTDQMQLRVAVRCGTKHSCYEVVIRPDSSSSPYRIENRSMFLPIHFRQVDGIHDSWQQILPNAAASFYWEDLGRIRLLELLPDGTDPLKSDKYNIDEIFDHQPNSAEGSPTKPLRVTVIKEEKINVVRICDWMPEMEPSAIMSRNYSASQNDFEQDSTSTSDCEFHFIVELAELGISIIDHTPEEILYLSVQNLLQTYSTGLGSGISRLKLKMRGIQVDNQLPLTPMPVLLRPQIQRVDGENDNILKLCITMQSNGSFDLYVYPHISLEGPQNNAFLINIQEPIIWRLHEMIQHVKLNRLSNSQATAVSVDPFIEIGVLNISEVRCKISLAMSPSQRPRGVLGFWLSLMTALGNTENMPIRINQRFLENVRMRQSSMISNAISNIQKDLLGQPLQLLSGVDILGNASSALGNISKGVAALSMDNTFIQSRQRQENKGVEDFGDVIREGGGALAKGLFRGVTGILTKPLEGAKTSGVEGFVQGFGKGIIGAAAQPVSGVFDLLSKTTEGANAVRMKLVAAITSDEQLLRRRHPRVVSGDNLVRPYNDYRAQGQVILQLAESGSFLGQADLFKVRGKFALSDAYEDHFLLPKGKILVVTHRRIMLLQQPANVIGQKNFCPAKDPCSILWDLLWSDIASMELSHGKKDRINDPPSLLIIYRQTTSSSPKDMTRTVKCKRETHQALQACSSIERAMGTYGPNLSKGMLKKVTKPYSPLGDGSGIEAVKTEGGIGSWSLEPVPESVLQGSIFGGVAK